MRNWVAKRSESRAFHFCENIELRVKILASLTSTRFFYYAAAWLKWRMTRWLRIKCEINIHYGFMSFSNCTFICGCSCMKALSASSIRKGGQCRSFGRICVLQKWLFFGIQYDILVPKSILASTPSLQLFHSESYMSGESSLFWRFIKRSRKRSSLFWTMCKCWRKGAQNLAEYLHGRSNKLWRKREPETCI